MLNLYLKYFLIFFIIILVIYFLKLQKQKIIKYKKWTKIQNDNYFNYFNKYDFKFRNCSNKKNCKEKYIDSFIPFSEQEEKIILDIITNFNKLIDYKYRFVFNEINLVKVDNNIESSMPHTRDNVIIFSQNIINRIISLYRTNPKHLFFSKLLAHEQFHIFQRKNPNLINTLYQDYWKMEKYHKKLPNEILKINRTNPDATPDINWLFKVKKGFILPLCVYRKDATSLRDTDNIFIRLDKNKNFLNLDQDLKKRNLLINQNEFVKFFGEESSNNYHSNEISSSLFELVIEEKITKEKKDYSEAFLLLKQFLEKIEI